MAIENAKRFLQQAMTDEKLRASIGEKELDEVVKIAKEAGFDVTADDLDEAIKMLRQNMTENLSDEELEKISGGAIWTAEDAPDGHEYNCILTYHNYNYQKGNNFWCKSSWFCSENYVEYNDRTYYISE